MTRYWERRRYIRVPASGSARWTSGHHRGHCQLVDISPGGAGVRMPIRKATQLGPTITLEVELSPGVTWNLPEEARVVRRVPDEDGQCLVGMEFAPERWVN
ncbi:MAG: PilZ domain-containing protein [Phycisphaerae bacterium]|nr:PilZ domain-containing protein [Phycisphaerae bacterium]